MELTLTQAAAVIGITPRRLQLAAAAGDLPVQRVAGNTQLVDSVILEGFTRAMRPGRKWGSRAASAALELLDGFAVTRLDGSNLSRLRGLLRGMDAGDIAHRLGATANWFRYLSATKPMAAVAAQVHLTGPSLLGDRDLADELGLVAGAGSMLFGVVPDLASLEVDLALSRYGEGDVFLTQRQDAPGRTAALVDLYLLGEARESAAAAVELERRAAAC